MRLAKLTALLVLVLVANVEAQSTGQNVRGLKWVSASAITVPTTFTSIDLPNIGQTSHAALISISGQTHNWNATAVIQGSMDGTNWFAIGPGVYPASVFLSTQSSISFAAFGTYPHLRCTAQVTPTGGDTLTVNAYYYGNSTPGLVSVDTTSLLSPVGSLSQGVAPSTNGALIINANPGTAFTFYGMFAYMPAGLASVNLFCSPSGTVLFNLPTIPAAGLPVIFPASLRPYAVCSPGDNVNIITGAGGTLQLQLTYRFE